MILLSNVSWSFRCLFCEVCVGVLFFFSICLSFHRFICFSCQHLVLLRQTQEAVVVVLVSSSVFLELDWERVSLLASEERGCHDCLLTHFVVHIALFPWLNSHLKNVEEEGKWTLVRLDSICQERKRHTIHFHVKILTSSPTWNENRKLLLLINDFLLFASSQMHLPNARNVFLMTVWCQ